MVTFNIETRYNVTIKCNIKHLCFFVMVACIARLLHLLRSSVCHDKSHCRLALRARRAGERLGFRVNMSIDTAKAQITSVPTQVRRCSGVGASKWL